MIWTRTQHLYIYFDALLCDDTVSIHSFDLFLVVLLCFTLIDFNLNVLNIHCINSAKKGGKPGVVRCF